jgi:hypothetical protein
VNEFQRVLEAPEGIRVLRINQKGSHELLFLYRSPVLQPAFMVLLRLVNDTHQAGIE